MNSNELFIKTPPLRLFFVAALPGAISMLASALYQLIDGILVGQYLGDTAFAALNLAMPFVIINFAIADLVGIGSSVPISIGLGEGDQEKANNYFTCACLMIVGAGVALGAILYAAAPALMALMGATGDFAEMAVQYLRTYAICSPVTTIIFAMDNFLRISGKIKGSMLLNILMSVLIVVLEFLFLSVFHWGIWGAALGSALGMAICAIIAFLFTNKEGKRIMVWKQVQGKIVWDLMYIFAGGSPNFLNNIAGRITSILMNLMLVRMGGETAVSVYGILMYVDGFIQPLLYGMCDSLQPAVGFNWGARNIQRVKAIEKRCYTAAIILALAITGVLALFPRQIAGLFITGDSDPAYLEMAVHALVLFSLTYITRWFSFATQSFLSAIEKPVAASAISVSTALVFPVVLIGVLWSLGLTGIWLNFAGTAVLAGILALILLLRQKELWNKDKKKAA